MSQHARIVLVEDDREQAALFAQVLTMAGHEVISTLTAEAALTALASDTVDLLLADWDLPGMKGDELIALVKARYPGVKTIIYSNHVYVDQACAACGADGWMRKTDGILRLRQVVNGVLAEQSPDD